MGVWTPATKWHGGGMPFYAALSPVSRPEQRCVLLSGHPKIKAAAPTKQSASR
jgi:hypothetical protein